MTTVGIYTAPTSTTTVVIGITAANVSASNINGGIGITRPSADDIEIAKTALENDGSCLEYTSDNIKNNRELVEIALKQDGSALAYASDIFKNDKVVVALAMDDFPNAFQYASDEMLEECSMAALMIVLTGIGPVILLNAAIKKASKMKKSEPLIF